jgi:primosomal protein N' (replication factor Y)
MEIIAHVLTQGKQAIVLIPEIALTYQTVMRFYRRFGEQVSFINSRLSKGERYDQFQRAKNGEISIMIGPRSALFTPFANLGLIIIDEEHEGAYKSEIAPRYHAIEVAKARANLCKAMVILGSATPLVSSYQKADCGEYQLLTMDKRAKKDSVLPQVYVVDLRQEMAAGNRTIFSRLLYEKIKDRLAKKEQILLFMNRRGYANFVSCRSCGEAIKCPHCDVSLTAHRNGWLHCHYCGYQIPAVKTCPSCGSPYIAGFGTGTQKVEAQLEKFFPKAKILRMDTDTTKGKDGHEKIVRAFANEEADILIGTQMIVKGHDFEKVTLVGVLAADMSLYNNDYRATERTFQLLTQAAGRAGRGALAGEVVIQTYKPEHYSIQAAASQDYMAFYREEIKYRKQMHYPPFWQMRVIQLSSPSQKNVTVLADALAAFLRQGMIENRLIVLGPSDPSVAKVNDIYYKKIYVKHSSEKFLQRKMEEVQQFLEATPLRKDVLYLFDVV